MITFFVDGARSSGAIILGVGLEQPVDQSQPMHEVAETVQGIPADRVHVH